MDERLAANLSRYRPGRSGGHYESWFVRANHPARPEALWIRYTIFQPAGRPQDAEGEVWATFFDGVGRAHVAAKVERPVRECEFGAHAFRVRVGECELGPGRLRGAAGTGAGGLAWDLAWEGDAPTMRLLPRPWYAMPLPPAKSITPWPSARFRGTLVAGGRTIDVADWPGGESHNWGTRHTDRYAWGQVVAFDGAPGVWLEATTARVRLGPLWSPWFNMLVLRRDGREYALNSAWRALRSSGVWRPYVWTIEGRRSGVRLRAEFAGAEEDFVVLRYRNPPGGTLECRNSTIARCRVTMTGAGGAVDVFETAHGAAFEMVGDPPPATASRLP